MTPNINIKHIKYMQNLVSVLLLPNGDCWGAGMAPHGLGRALLLGVEEDGTGCDPDPHPALCVCDCWAACACCASIIGSWTYIPEMKNREREGKTRKE
jgi:hypothetical protein